MLLSGIMLPMTLAPGWLQGVARVSPFRYIIDAMREAFLGHYANTIMLEGVLVAVGPGGGVPAARVAGVRARERLGSQRARVDRGEERTVRSI